MKLKALTENNWILGHSKATKISIPRSGFWADNAPAKYKDHKLTDPRIPRSVILDVAKKHPHGLHGFRSAIQSLINMGSARGSSMSRLRRIAKWISGAIKDEGIHERIDGQIRKNAYIAKSAPSTHEIGWLGHRKFRGSKESVQIRFDPTDPDIKDNYIFHTHPSDEPSPIRAMPSETDLQTAANSTEHGLMGTVIFCGPFYTVIMPTTRTKDRIMARRYEEAIRRGDMEDAIKEIEKLGFDIETGEV